MILGSQFISYVTDISVKQGISDVVYHTILRDHLEEGNEVQRMPAQGNGPKSGGRL
jgi:hypothetical protein